MCIWCLVFRFLGTELFATRSGFIVFVFKFMKMGFVLFVLRRRPDVLMLFHFF